MPQIGTMEIVGILIVVLLVFGVGRVGKIGGELGRAIREFRKEVSGDGAEKPKDKDKEHPPYNPPTN